MSFKKDLWSYNEILYLTRLQNLTLEEDGTSIDGITFANNFISSPELIIRFSNNFKSSLETVSLEQQIKTEFENGNALSTCPSLKMEIPNSVKITEYMTT